MNITFEKVAKTKEAARLIMAWRNDPVTLAMSYHSEPKKWPGFWKEYQDMYCADPDFMPVFAFYNNVLIGFIQFRPYTSNIKAELYFEGLIVDISITLASAWRNKGFGSSIIRQAVHYIFRENINIEKIIAEIKPNNIASIKAFKNAGFIFYDEHKKYQPHLHDVIHIKRYLINRINRFGEPVRSSAVMDNIMIGKIDVFWRKPDDCLREKLASCRTRVDKIWWDAYAEKEATLFNGNVFSVTSITADDKGYVLSGCFLEYKYIYAQMQDCSIDIGATPLAVSGLTCYGNGKQMKYLVGQRNNTSEYNGFWEFVPSGSIDLRAKNDDGSINLIAHIKTELWEEGGINAYYVRSVEPFMCCFDHTHRVYDIGMRVIVTSEEVSASHEHENLMWIQHSQMKEFINAHKENMVPASVAMFEISKLK